MLELVTDSFFKGLASGPVEVPVDRLIESPYERKEKIVRKNHGLKNCQL